MDSARSSAFPGALWQRLCAHLPGGGKSGREGEVTGDVHVATEKTPLVPIHPLVIASFYVAPAQSPKETVAGQTQTGRRGAYAARPLGQGAVVGVAIQRRVGVLLTKTSLGRAINCSLEPNCRLLESAVGYLVVTRRDIPTAVELTVSRWDWPRIPTL